MSARAGGGMPGETPSAKDLDRGRAWSQEGWRVLAIRGGPGGGRARRMGQMIVNGPRGRKYGTGLEIETGLRWESPARGSGLSLSGHVRAIWGRSREAGRPPAIPGAARQSGRPPRWGEPRPPPAISRLTTGAFARAADPCPWPLDITRPAIKGGSVAVQLPRSVETGPGNGEFVSDACTGEAVSKGGEAIRLKGQEALGSMTSVLHVVTGFTEESSTLTPWLIRLVVAQKQLGLDVRVLTAALRGRKDDVVHDIPVYRFRYSPAGIENLSTEVAIDERLRRNRLRYLQVPLFLGGGYLRARRLASLRPDVVHVHWPIPMGLLALPFRRAALVFHYHQTDVSLVRRFPLLRPLFAPVLKRAQVHLCNSSFTQTQLRDAFRPLELPAQVVPMPLGWPIPDELPQKEPGRILFVGRMVHWKGGDLLIEACETLDRRGVRFHLVMVGEGPERSKWEVLARERSVRAEFRGWRRGKELMDEYARATVLALPSRHDRKVWAESLGVALLEAMACGTAVVASRFGGPVDLVQDGRNGYLFEPFNARDLADKLAQVLEDFDRAARLGQEGRRTALSHAPEAVAKRLNDVYAAIRA